MAKDPLKTYDMEHRRAEQLGDNCRWLIGITDAINRALCPDKIGTWQKRAEYALETAKEIGPSPISPKILVDTLVQVQNASIALQAGDLGSCEAALKKAERVIKESISKCPHKKVTLRGRDKPDTCLDCGEEV